MTSKFSTSASRAQHTPKVCISKQREAAHVDVPTWQRAVVTVDIPTDRNNAGIPIYQTNWLTRSGPNVGWERDEPIANQINLAIIIRQPVNFELDDVTISVYSTAIPPAFPASVYSAACPTNAWSHTLYGGRSPIIHTDSAQAGVVSIRFDAEKPTLV